MALEPFWTFYNPAADCTATESGGVLSLAIPSGSTHDIWTTNNNGPRLTQPANNVDFTIETKLTTTPATSNSRGGGLIVQTDVDNWIRFSTHHDGTNHKIFAAYVDNGSSSTTVFNTTFTPTYPLWLRLVRTGNSWDCYRSTDGSSFTLQGTFSKTLTINSVGLCAFTAGTNPAWTMTFDYFMADGITNLQTGDHIESGILDSFFSATTIYALGRSELLTIRDSFTAESLAPITSDADANDTMTIRDTYSAEVIRGDQLAWTQATKQTTNWTDR
jgi:regulation of enolase protein 1 (concanavalin A-like superfamily)